MIKQNLKYIFGGITIVAGITIACFIASFLPLADEVKWWVMPLVSASICVLLGSIKIAVDIMVEDDR